MSYVKKRLCSSGDKVRGGASVRWNVCKPTLLFLILVTVTVLFMFFTWCFFLCFYFFDIWDCFLSHGWGMFHYRIRKISRIEWLKNFVATLYPWESTYSFDVTTLPVGRSFSPLVIKWLVHILTRCVQHRLLSSLEFSPPTLPFLQTRSTLNLGQNYYLPYRIKEILLFIELKYYKHCPTTR